MVTLAIRDCAGPKGGSLVPGELVEAEPTHHLLDVRLAQLREAVTFKAMELQDKIDRDPGCPFARHMGADSELMRERDRLAAGARWLADEEQNRARRRACGNNPDA